MTAPAELCADECNCSICRMLGYLHLIVRQADLGAALQPDGYRVNARCLEPDTIVSMTIEPSAGVHWEANAGKLAHLTR